MNLLTANDIETFKLDGFLVCPAIMDEPELDAVRAAVDGVLQTRGFTPETALHRHIDARIIFDLCKSDSVVERLAALLGPDLLLWHTRLFDKPPGHGIVPWHQDKPFWPIDPDICISAWIAIDEADRENGCLEFIPGSHRKKVDHIPSVYEGRFGKMADPAHVNEAGKVSIELKPGEFVLFDRWLIHGSRPNQSNRSRIGLAARFIPPHVRVDFDEVAHTFPELGAQIIKGEDKYGRNKIAAPPQT